MRSSLFAIVALALTLSLSTAEAVTIAPVAFSELVSRAETIAYGRVSAVEGQWTMDRQRIESLVTIDVVDRFKGRGGTSLTFKIPGGRAGNRINVLPGAPAVREGDLVVVFLASHGPAIPMPVGLSQGILRVGVDARSGSLRVDPPLGFGGESGRIVRGSPQRAPIALSTLARGVRDLVEAAR